MVKLDQERPEVFLEESAGLATVAIDDHASGTVKSPTTFIHLETYPSGLGMESPTVCGYRVPCLFFRKHLPTPAQTRFARNPPTLLPLIILARGVVPIGFRLRSACTLTRQAALKNRHLVAPCRVSQSNVLYKMCEPGIVGIYYDAPLLPIVNPRPPAPSGPE